MKQVIRKGIREIVVDEVPDPAVGPHQVVVRPLFSLISSGTETASIHQEGALRVVADNPSHLRKVWEVCKTAGPWKTLREVRAKFSEYAVLGYSGAGLVIDKHAGVTDLALGERVAYGGEGTGHGEAILAGRNLVARVPDGVPFEHACFATLGSIALNAVRIANLQLGEWTVVLGLGLVGQLIAQLARLQGARVIAIDLRADRVRLARKLSAEHGVEGEADPRAAVAAITEGRGADCVFVAAAAKSAEPCRSALDMCRDRGRLVVVGAVDLSFPWNDMYLKEIQLYMARAYGPGSYDPNYEGRGIDYPFAYVRWTENRNMEEFLRLLAARQVDLQPLITHEFPLDDAPKAYETILDPAAGSLAVLLRYPAASEPETTEYRPLRKVTVTGQPAKQGALGVAVIGAGNLSRWEHLPILQKLPGVSLRAVHSASGARGKGYATRFGAAYCTSDYDVILKDPQVDAVLIATRNQYHAPQALAALQAGKHVFVEKPMALTEDECRQLLRAVQDSGRQIMVGFNRRFASCYTELKRELSRRAGPALVHCRINSPGISGNYWMADPAVGGAILGEACHFVDLMYWLLESEPLEVTAYCLPTDKREPIGENNLTACFRFADGSVGSLTYCTVGSRTSAGERVEVFAEGLGAASQDFKRVTVQRRMQHTHRRWWPEKGYQAELRSFVEHLRNGTACEVTALDGARATLGCLRMLESAKSLTPLTVDLPRWIEHDGAAE